MHHLNHYPQVIHDTTFALAKIDNDIAVLKLEIKQHELTAESGVAFDSELKNDSQRKVKLNHILQRNTAYLSAFHDLQTNIHQRDLILAKLEQYRNEFQIAKLEARMQLAERMLALDSRDLADVREYDRTVDASHL